MISPHMKIGMIFILLVSYGIYGPIFSSQLMWLRYAPPPQLVMLVMTFPRANLDRYPNY